MDSDQLAVRLDSELPARLAVGGGSCLCLSGRCSHPQGIEGLDLLVDGARQETIAHGMPPGDGFWGLAPIGAVTGPRKASIGLVATLAEGRTGRQQLGEVELLPRQPSIESVAEPEWADGPLIAICMATFEPPAELLERQIESLRAQTHRRWICLVSDDCSSPAGCERLRALTAGDRRFFVSRSPARLGHYRNFERALSMVPPAAELVAFCDQDDRWHPDKLSTLAAAIGNANLVYSDMRVLGESGAVLSETFWSYKRNNHTNLASLLLDNTVTGAAALFRRALLDLALPFPPPMEGSHHDHWVASVALASGRIAYVDRPLHDYVQHPSAATPSHPAARDRVAGGSPDETGRDRLAEGRLHYFKDLLRVALAARVLELRLSPFRSRATARAVRKVARLAEPPEPTLWLALRSLRSFAGRNETLHTERSLLKAVAWRRLAARRGARAR